MQRGLILTLLILIAPVAAACNIPVFRYALERWQPDNTELLVFHSGTPDADTRAALQPLQAMSVDGGGNANLDVTLVDVDTALPDSLAAVWKAVRSDADPQLPWVVARTRVQGGRWYEHWQGPLSSVGERQLFDSPVRRELSRRLATGDAVVWLMLESPDRDRNQAVRRHLTDQFEELSRTIALPEGIGEPGSELYSDVPLLLQFSVLAIDPADPRERHLRRLVTGMQPGAVAAGEPILIPVFGRGRALEVIPASQLDAGLIGDLTRFLCGACSCQVKDLNPGFDLLLREDWDTRLFGDDPQAPRPRTSDGAGQQRTPVLVPIPQGRDRDRD